MSPPPQEPSSISAASSSTSNPYSALISQETCIVPSFTLESGVELKKVPVAYKTWGKLNKRGDNCLVICHALTGSADVEDWWGPLLGPDRAFDPTRFFIFCGNVIGSPYGTVSSVSINPDTGKPYGPEMPGSSVKDDVRLHYIVLKQLGVKSVAAVIGGSMGGMTTLEWPLNSPPGFVRAIIPLATSARHSAWCISWGETQRQSIYSDPDYRDGYYYETPTGAIEPTHQPTRGLAAARMAALLTYRSRDSFESRFGRKTGVGRGTGGRGGGASKVPKGGVRIMGGPETTNPADPSEAELGRSPAWRAHNDGYRSSTAGSRRASGSGSPTVPESSGSGREPGPGPGPSSLPTLSSTTMEVKGLNVEEVKQSKESKPSKENEEQSTQSAVGPINEITTLEKPLTSLDLGVPGSSRKLGTGGERQPKIFNAQSYLRYQGDKFTSRFDANCYIHITRKLDTHDLSHPSTFTEYQSLSSTLPVVPYTATDEELESALHHALSLLPPALVIGIESDGLFQPSEQKELAAHIPDAELVIIPSPEGHDGFLLEFEAINGWIQGWLMRKFPEYYIEEGRLISLDEWRASQQEEQQGWAVKKESVFGEAEADVTRW